MSKKFWVSHSIKNKTPKHHDHSGASNKKLSHQEGEASAVQTGGLDHSMSGIEDPNASLTVPPPSMLGER